MASRFLKDLFPPEITVPGVGKFVLLEDRHIYDTETVTTTERTHEFFVSRSGKQETQANFFGDFSLVKESNIFVPIQISVFPRLRTLTKAEWFSFHNQGQIDFSVTVPQKIQVLQDRIANVSQHVSYHRTATVASVDEAVARSTFNDRRTIIVVENKIVPGGRSIKLKLEWPEGTNGLTVNTEIVVEFYGGEYEREGGGK